MAGDWSGMPIGRTADTWKVCSPGARPVYVAGDEQAVNGPRSIEHSKVAVPCDEKNVNVADVDELGSVGVLMISVSGSFTPSGSAIVHSNAAGGSSRRPNLFVDCTSNEWSPRVRCVCVTGEAHGASSAPSSEHMYDTPVWLDVQLNVALVPVVVVTPSAFDGTLAVIVVSAGPSTIHVYSSDVESKCPAGSIARIRTVCEPGSRPVNSAVFSGGEAHSLQTRTGTGSIAHSKLTPGSGLARRKIEAASALTSAGGPDRIDVSGRVTSSTVHSQTAATGSASRCSLSAVTSNVCGPPALPFASARSASSYVTGDSQNVGTAPSREQRAKASGSSTVKVNVAVVLVVATAGPVWIVITGGVTSPTIHSYTAGSRSTAPIGPFARTWSSCSPSGTVI